MQVWLNGRFVSPTEARVSLFDSGFQHAVGVFTTLSFRNGRAFRLSEHLRRLKGSATGLSLLEVLEEAPLAGAVAHTIEKSGLLSGRVRITVTGGDMMLAPSAGGKRSAHHDPTIAIVVQGPTSYPDEIYSSGVRVRIADQRLDPGDPFAGHKTLWYWPRLRELHAAAAAGCAESLFFTPANRLVSAAVGNVFLVAGSRLLTPATRAELAGDGNPGSAVLPGVTRGVICELAQGQGLTVERSADLTVDHLLGAQEIFITNSSWGVLPVVAVEAGKVGSGVPGPITHSLRSAYLAQVELQTDPQQGWVDPVES